MAKRQRETRIPLKEVSERLERQIDSVDPARVVGLEGLQTIRAARVSGLQRECSRLAAKLGADHPRVLAMLQKSEANQALVRQLAFEAQRAAIEIPTVDEKTWMLHGHVLSRESVGIPNLTVALFDEGGRLAREFGFACTDRSGYFRLSRSLEDEEVEAKGRGLFVHVSDRNRTPLHADSRCFIPKGGRIDYVQILLGEAPPACVPPPGEWPQGCLGFLSGKPRRGKG